MSDAGAAADEDAYLRIGYLYSSPLSNQAPAGGLEVLGLLDHRLEVKMVLDLLRDAERQVVFKAEVATVRSIGKLLSLGCDILHFTGHGHAQPRALAFEREEEGCGRAKLIEVDALRSYFAAGQKRRDGSLRTQLVFVSACHSEELGSAFADAGVPHVVAVRSAEQITDEAARVFAGFFYTALLAGQTVQAAFDMAQAQAATHWSGRDSHILLLPAGAAHDVHVVGPRGLPPPRGLYVNETRRLPLLVNCPAPGNVFLGRTLQLQEVVSHIVSRLVRCVSIQGPAGVGKTELAVRAANYLRERRMYDFIFFAALDETASTPGGPGGGPATPPAALSPHSFAGGGGFALPRTPSANDAAAAAAASATGGGGGGGSGDPQEELCRRIGAALDAPRPTLTPRAIVRFLRARVADADGAGGGGGGGGGGSGASTPRTGRGGAAAARSAGSGGGAAAAAVGGDGAASASAASGAGGGRHGGARCLLGWYRC